MIGELSDYNLSLSKIKSLLFIILVLLCFSEQWSQLLSLVQGIQPRRAFLPTYFLLLSPASLVFDRKEGFVRSRLVDIKLADGSIHHYKFNEANDKFPNLLELILVKKVFSSFASGKLIRHYFCEYNLKSLGPKPNSRIEEVLLFSSNDPSFKMRVPCLN